MMHVIVLVFDIVMYLKKKEEVYTRVCRAKNAKTFRTTSTILELIRVMRSSFA